MEELQTDTLSDYGKKQSLDTSELDSSKENACAASPLNGCDDLDPLDLMDNCDNESIGSNSDVWKGSDSEEEFEPKDSASQNPQSETNSENTNPVDADATLETSTKETEIIESEETTSKNNEVKDKQAEEETKITEEKQSENEEDPENSESIPKENNTLEETEKASDTEKNDEIQEKNDDTPPKEREPTSVNLEENIENNSEKPATPDKPDNDNKEAESQQSETVPASEQPTNTENIEAEPPTQQEKDTSENSLREISEGNDDNPDENDDCQMDYDADDDFDPSLLCPEVSMDVDDNPVVTTNGPVPDGECGSPLPFEPLFSTFVDEVTGAEISFNLTPEELDMKKRIYGARNPIQTTRIHCTACNVHLGSALDGQHNRFVHPLLKVLICKKCYHFYTSGDFDKDEDGSELYCRWCGQGGQVLCCSKCEFVFCKRCIRTNFGKKKMAEIRDSDCWDCFRCNPSQMMTQRIHCFELFEYIKKETVRASTFTNSEIWSRDYTRCCTAKKRPAENGEEVKKPKKRKGETEIDPDYDPTKENTETVDTPTPVTQANVNFAPTLKGVLSKQMHVVPRYVTKTQDNDIEFVRQIPAPQVTITNLPKPTYRAILPSIIRPVATNSTMLRINPCLPPPALVPTTNRVNLPNKNLHSPAVMKHEWFEKTVRAAARVNSHLSYTLTQLNKAQSQASSVEELAVVHNKLQEILSSSINSLIQIRKNLRTEFIAGIKTVRLPTKKVDDDDVILVSAPPTMPMPSTSFVRPATDPLIIIERGHPQPPRKDNVEQPKTYLKVKSVMELQNVPSECITIPDDPPTAKGTKTGAIEVFCNGAVNDAVDPLALSPNESNSVAENSNGTPTLSNDSTEVPKRGKAAKSSQKSQNSNQNSKSIESQSETRSILMNKEQPSGDLKRMMSVTVKLTKVDLHELQKKIANEVK